MSTTPFAVDSDPAAGALTQEAALRAAGASGLIAIGFVHFMDFFSKIQETFYLGLLYLVLIGLCLALAGVLVSGRNRATAWKATAAVAAVTALAYVTSRTVGLPASTLDIGNWLEPLGLASLFVEGLVILMAGWALRVGRPSDAWGDARQRARG